MKTKTELMNLSRRYERAAKAMHTASIVIEDAISETDGTEYGDRTREMLYEAAKLLMGLTQESRKLAEQVEAMPPDEEEAGDAMEVAERPGRFETA